MACACTSDTHCRTDHKDCAEYFTHVIPSTINIMKLRSLNYLLLFHFSFLFDISLNKMAHIIDLLLFFSLKAF